jgi:hypothetical protein
VIAFKQTDQLSREFYQNLTNGLVANQIENENETSNRSTSDSEVSTTSGTITTKPKIIQKLLAKKVVPEIKIRGQTTTDKPLKEPPKDMMDTNKVTMIALLGMVGICVIILMIGLSYLYFESKRPIPAPTIPTPPVPRVEPGQLPRVLSSIEDPTQEYSTYVRLTRSPPRRIPNFQATSLTDSPPPSYYTGSTCSVQSAVVSLNGFEGQNNLEVV